MKTLPNTAFFTRLQSDGINLVELIDLELNDGTAEHWTTCNQEITYTLSSVATKYSPFPGTVPSGINEDMDLGVSVTDFVIANTGTALQNKIYADTFKQAEVKVGRVFIETPDLGRMDIYRGQMGDFNSNRMVVQGELRSVFSALNVQWPQYSYQDTCVWKFGSAGCGFDVSTITVTVNSIQINSSDSVNITCRSGVLSVPYADARFNFGKVTVSAGANSGEVRSVRTHTGDLLMLSHPFPSSDLTGLTLTVHPGCRKNLETDCHLLYDNSINFLGFPWIPVQEQAFI